MSDSGLVADRGASTRFGSSRRNLIGFGAVALIVLVGVFTAASRSSASNMNCGTIRTSEIERARSVLRVELEAKIAAAQRDLDEVDGAFTAALAELGLAEAVRVSSQAQLSDARDELEKVQSERDETLSELVALQTDVAEMPASQTEPIVDAAGDPAIADESRVLSLEMRIESLDSTKASLVASSDASQARLESTHEEIGSLNLQLETRRADRDIAQDRLVAKHRAWKATSDVSGTASNRYAPDRSSANLVPEDPIAFIAFGSKRSPTRVEVRLADSSTVRTEGRSEPAESGIGDSATFVELPEKVEFITAIGQIRRSGGPEIPSERITVWARRVGPWVQMNVCIAPGPAMDAGTYTGAVYMIDPSLNPVTIPIEITAQSRMINWLYILLIISPSLAFMYIWVTGRLSAGANPWDLAAFKRWAGENLILTFAIGFAAVWATLQVPFNNPTWGTSMLSAAAVVGVGLVAAVTAMTAVAGRVRGPGIDNDDQGSEKYDARSPTPTSETSHDAPGRPG